MFLPFFAAFKEDASEPEDDAPGGAGNAPWAIAGKGLGGSARNLSGESSETVASSARRVLPLLLLEGVGAPGRRRAVDVDEDVDAMLDTVPKFDAFSPPLRRLAPDTDGPTLHALKLGSGEAGELEDSAGDVEADVVDGGFVVKVWSLFVCGSAFPVRVDDELEAYPEPVDDVRGRFAYKL